MFCKKEKQETEFTPESIDRVLDEEEFNAIYGHSIYKKLLFIAICVASFILVSGISMTIGEYDIGFFESYVIAWNHLFGDVGDTTKDFVIWEIRLPRIIAGIISGVGLATCGAVMQSTMKNPLADPYTTGISSGASFGATLAIILGLTIIAGDYAIVLNAFIFALIPMALIMLISSIRKTTATMIILCGIAVMYLFNAMTTVMMLMANPNDLAAVYSWQVGTLGSSSWNTIPIMFTFVLVGFVILELLSSKINVLASGDENAKSLGLNAEQLRLICLLVVSLVAASVVSFTGIIGFVGLVCPHMCRMILGSDNRYLIPASGALGATLMVACDLIGRTIIAPSVLQVGVVTAFIGGPMFLWLLLRQKKEVW